MTGFWIVAALMLAAALLLLARPLLRARPLQNDFTSELNVTIARERLKELEAEHRKGELSDEEYRQARSDLEMALALDIGSSTTDSERSAPSSTPDNQVNSLDRTGLFTLSIVAILLSVLTVGLYQKLGSPEHIDIAGPGSKPPQPIADAHSDQAVGVTRKLPPVEEMVYLLEQRMEGLPDDSQGWFLLGQTYMKIGRYTDAVPVFERVRELVGDEVVVLLSLADALAMSENGRLSGRPAELVKQVLGKEPNNVTALWLSGNAAQESGDLQAAVGYWRQVLPFVVSDPEVHQELLGMIASVEQQFGYPVAAAALIPVKSTAPLPAQPIQGEQMPAKQMPAKQIPAKQIPAKQIQVTVKLAESLQNKVSPEDTLFIFAKAVTGPPMPLAVVRKQVKDLPLVVMLDDSQAMMPAMAISRFDEVMVSAKISKSGNATDSDGVIRSDSIKAKTNAGAKVNLLISVQSGSQ